MERALGIIVLLVFVTCILLSVSLHRLDIWLGGLLVAGFFLKIKSYLAERSQQ